VSFSQRINSYTSGISLTDWHTMNRIEMATWGSILWNRFGRKLRVKL
jgi:hypothetical protein